MTIFTESNPNVFPLVGNEQLKFLTVPFLSNIKLHQLESFKQKEYSLNYLQQLNIYTYLIFNKEKKHKHFESLLKFGSEESQYKIYLFLDSTRCTLKKKYFY